MPKKAGIDSVPDVPEEITSEAVTLEPAIPEAVITVKSDKPEEPTQVPSEIIIMSLKEFASSLNGSDVLLASAMSQEFLGQRMSKTAWTNALKRFGNREA